jgi:hypothetical protein
MKTYDTIVDGITYTIVIGQNKYENWELIDDADPSDIWFHSATTPSAHIILYAPKNGIIPSYIIRLCANKIGSRDVIFTKISNIRKGRHTGEAVILDTKQLYRNTI